MKWFLLLIACLAGPATADERGVAGTAFKLEEDGSILEVNLFPIAADFETIIYAACPVIVLENESEMTDCRIGVTDRNGVLNSFTALGVCTAEQPWSAECPDFGGEGFTEGNRAKLDALIAIEDLSHDQKEPPKPLPQQIQKGGKGILQTYRTHSFEVLTDCEGFVGEVRNLCGTLEATPPSLYSAFVSAGRTTVCLLGDGNRLVTCRSNKL